MTTPDARYTESLTAQLTARGMLKPPKFLPARVCYETQMGSVAYGVSQDASDVDVYGFCVPPREVVFPHLAGVIEGFGRQHQRFDQFQKHHVRDDEAGCTYDMNIYSIVRYVHLCMENNPNMLESLFTPRRCVLYTSSVAERLRERRQVFLHKGSWFKFKGFAYSQIHKMRTKEPEGKRMAMVEQFGFDVKFAYHAVRLMREAEQVLTEHDLDLEAHAEELLQIRRGEWTQEEVESFFSRKEIELEALYEQSTLPHSPDEDAIRDLLLECLEETYGSLDGCIV
ncbi:MAG: nucleotidyltransferase domain-containing protein, partial [Myxococcales bacterium]|nr:nucleotidyltransferase domain-containing protein [Myxococcales bacterium]